MSKLVERPCRRSSRAESSGSTGDDSVACTPPKEHEERSQRQMYGMDTPRSSERIRTRRNRSFTKPNRQKVLDSISSKKSPEKLIDSLKPRHLVNNFTKENHRYNYDPAYTDESSADDFIDDEPSDVEEISQSESDQSGEDEENCSEASTPPPDLRLKKGQNTSRLESDSDSNDEIKIRHNSIIESDSEANENESSPQNAEESKHTSVTENGECSMVKTELHKLGQIEGISDNVSSVQKVSSEEPQMSKQSDTDSDMSESEIISPKSKTKPRKRKTSKTKKQVINSDSSEDSDGGAVGRKRAYLASDPSSDSEGDRLYSSAEEVDDEGKPHRQSSGRAQILSGHKDYRRCLLAELSSKRKKPSGLTKT